jgi:hypothetical protein
MISPDGRFIWWKSNADGRRKISIPLDLYLFHVAHSTSLAELATGVGMDPATTSTPLTPEEITSLQETKFEIGEDHTHDYHQQSRPKHKVLAKGV